MDFDYLHNRIKIVDLLIKDYLEISNNTMARPPEIEEYLISKGVYKSSSRKGKFLREDLRELEKIDKLNIFTHVKY